MWLVIFNTAGAAIGTDPIIKAGFVGGQDDLPQVLTWVR